MKTAISIPDDIFEDINKLSKKLSCSRSKLFTDAAKEYIEKMRNKQIFDDLNDAYGDKETVEETKVRGKSKKYHAKMLKRDKW